jgi:hypothetical protein
MFPTLWEQLGGWPRGCRDSIDYGLREMSDWSPEKAIAMERRHILEGEKRVSRQEALVEKLVENGGGYQRMHTANEVLGLLRESLDFSRERLRYLEDHYGKARKRN